MLANSSCFAGRATLCRRNDVLNDVEPSMQQQWRTPRRKLFRAAGKNVFWTLCHRRGVVSMIIEHPHRAYKTEFRHISTTYVLLVFSKISTPDAGCLCGAIRCSSVDPLPPLVREPGNWPTWSRFKNSPVRQRQNCRLNLYSGMY